MSEFAQLLLVMQEKDARIAELEADLKCVLDREAATYGRHGARITVLEDERDALAARVKELEERDDRQ